MEVKAGTLGFPEVTGVWNWILCFLIICLLCAWHGLSLVFKSSSVYKELITCSKGVLIIKTWTICLKCLLFQYSPARASLSPSTSSSSSSTQIYCGVCASTLIDTDFASPKVGSEKKSRKTLNEYIFLLFNPNLY